MAERRGGAGFLWFVVGFLAGVLVTLAAMLSLEGRRAGRTGAVETAEVQAPAPARPVRRLRPTPKPPVEPAATPASEAPAPAPDADDEQVAEDAAAAGMTSRRAEATQP